MSYLQPGNGKGPKKGKVLLTPGQALERINTIAEEANEKIGVAYALRDYWYGLAEELGEELRDAAVENNALREQVEEIEALRAENLELKEKLAKYKQKVRQQQEEEIELEKQKRRKR